MLPDPEQQPLATVDEVAVWLGIGRDSVYGAVHRGEILSVRLGRKLLVPVAPLRRLIGLDTTLDDGHDQERPALHAIE